MSVLALADAGAVGADVVGGKALGLARLAALGLPVPEARVVPAEVHARWRREGRLGDADATVLRALAGELTGPLAVRSSAADEDAGDRSAAGQYESVMGVDGADALLAAVEHCYAAADGERARAYRGDAPAQVALVVQRLVAAERAGVGFSLDPVTGDASHVLVEAAFGHGEGVVSGAVTPDRYRVPREASAAVRARVAEKRVAAHGDGTVAELAPERRFARVLRDDEARAVAELVMRAERGFGVPVDVEFCLAGPETWLVQARPITAMGDG